MNKSAQHDYPIKVIQFGEGNFLRAFIDWMIDILNECGDFNGSVAIIQPLENGIVQDLSQQNNHYHHVKQGLENGQKIDEVRKITCISKAIDPFSDPSSFFAIAEESEAQLVFSNTTEAGIAFDNDDHPNNGELASTFPGKLTQLLKRRFDHFKQNNSKGLAIIPCELIEQNGDQLKECVRRYARLWNLGDAFSSWLDESCSFANTLVDRIVPGYPSYEIDTLLDRIGEPDKLVVKSESFHLFVIQADEKVRQLFPAHEYGLNVKYVDDISPYRDQKVRILNGAHTAMVPIGILSGLSTVGDVIHDPIVGKYIRELIYEEIIPTIHIQGEDPSEFAGDVINRFQNPFIKHELVNISLNSISKFRVRMLPTLLEIVDGEGEIPTKIVFALASLIKLYTTEGIILKDEQAILTHFDIFKEANPRELINQTLSNHSFWGMSLTHLPYLEERVLYYFELISTEGIKGAISELAVQYEYNSNV